MGAWAGQTNVYGEAGRGWKAVAAGLVAILVGLLFLLAMFTHPLLAIIRHGGGTTLRGWPDNVQQADIDFSIGLPALRLP